MLVREVIKYLQSLPDEQKDYDITVFDINYKHKGIITQANGMFKHISFVGDYAREITPCKPKRKRKEIMND